MAQPGVVPSNGVEGMSEREARAAVVSAAGLYTVGAALTATSALLPNVSSEAGVIAVGVTALITATGLMIAVARGHASLSLAFAADVWGVVLVGFLCASTGGASSPLGLLYFFAIGHAAAFQPRNRFLLVSLTGLLAFLAPLAYTDVSTSFGAIACVGIVLALLGSAVVHMALERMRDQRWRLEFLIAATAKLDTSLDPQQTLRRIAHTAVPQLAELCVIDLVDQSQGITTTVAASVDPAIGEEVERMREIYSLDLHGSHPVARALSTGRPCVVHDLSDSAELRQVAQSDEHEQFMQNVGYRSVAVFPMVARGRTLGTVSFLHVNSDLRYETGQLDVLADLTGRAALAFDNARLYAERAHVAHTLRSSLMPARLPDVPGLELASYFRPMDAGNEVGGDFYDVVAVTGGCWLVVGDVCGKGAEAAALTAFLRHTTVAYAREGAEPATVLTKVNEAMLDQDFGGRFATMILAHIEKTSQSEIKLTIAAAGHPPALLTRASGGVEELGEHGTLLGVFADPVIREASTTLQPGDSLALYTDGLPEAHAPERLVTSQQMIAQLANASTRTPQDMIDALVGLAVLDDAVRDDVAILAARVQDPGAG